MQSLTPGPSLLARKSVTVGWDEVRIPTSYKAEVIHSLCPLYFMDGISFTTEDTESTEGIIKEAFVFLCALGGGSLPLKALRTFYHRGHGEHRGVTLLKEFYLLLPSEPEIMNTLASIKHKYESIRMTRQIYRPYSSQVQPGRWIPQILWPSRSKK